MEYLPGETQFIVRSGVGWNSGVVGHARVGADLESPTGYAFQTGEPVISNHLVGETRFRTPALLVEHGIKRAINVVIQGDRNRYGVLEVDSPSAGQFTEHDLAFLQGFANLLGIAIERQQAEEELQASEVRLKETIAYQTVLTREISHRVKNSLAMVAGLLSMQSRSASDPVLRRALDDARTRVRTIAQIHDRLWRANEVHTIDLAAFMTELCNHICETLPTNQTLTYDFAPVMVATDQAVPLALLANELITNAFKYAYSESGGEVRITIQPGEHDHLRLSVRDKGRGLPDDFDLESSDSLGMTLIAGLVQQLGGRSEWQDAGPGTCFVLDFVTRQDPG